MFEFWVSSYNFILFSEMLNKEIPKETLFDPFPWKMSGSLFRVINVKRGPQKLWTRSFLGPFKVFDIRSKFLAIVQSFYKRRNYKGLLVQSFLRSKFLNQKLSKVLFNSYNTVRNSFSCNYFGLHYRKCITDCILVISFSSYSLCIIFGNRL